MDRFRQAATALVSIVALTVAGPVSAGPPATVAEGTVAAAGGPTAVPGSYIVTLKEGATRADGVERLAGTLAGRHDGRVARTFRHALRGFEAQLSEHAARRLAADPAVASVTQNHRVRASDVASWGLDRVDQRALPLDGAYTAPGVSPVVRAYLSLGGTSYAPMNTALANSIADGVSYGVAAGNDRSTDACTRFPASVPAAIAVAATATDDSRAAFSNIGPCVDLFAPGVGITSAYIGGDTATHTANGTSMAAPHVTGAAALILADHPSYTPAQVTAELLAEATAGVVTDAGAGSPNRLLYVDATAPADDFTLAATPASLTTTAGGAVSATVSTTVTRGAPQPVTLAVSGLPAGATASFSATTVDAGGTATLTVSTTTATPAGSYRLALIGTGRSATRPALLRLTVEPAAGCVGASAADVSLQTGRVIDLPLTVTGCSGAASTTSTIEVRIDHTDISDLELYLLSPDGTSHLLVSRTGSGQADFHYTMTRDLSAELTDGTWKLRVQDGGSGGSGLLDSWALDLGARPLPAPTCGGVTGTDVPIGAAATVESHITVAGCGADAGGHAYAELHIFNKYAHHLETTLIAPDGTEFQLFDPRRNFAVDLQTTYVVDLSGHRANGRWTLRVQDTDWASPDEGHIDGWKLTL